MNSQPGSASSPSTRDNLISLILAQHAANKMDEARIASDELLQLEPENYAALHLAGVVATSQKRLPEAAEFFKKALARATNAIDAAASWCGLGQALYTANDFRQGEEAFRRANQIDPQVCDYVVQLGLTQAAAWKWDTAMATLQTAIKRYSAEASPCIALGTILTKAGRQNDALLAFELALQRQPDNVSAHHNFGMVLKMLGRYQEAEAEMRKALQGNPNAGLYTQLAQLKKASPQDPQIDLIKTRLAPGSNAPVQSRIDATFALAKIYDDLSDYSAAFHYLHDANELKRSTIDYSISESESMIEGIINLYSKDFLNRFENKSASQLSPIFVVGMPRSGTTLTEQILVSHSQVQGGGELPYIIKFVSDIGDLWGSRGDEAPGDEVTVANDLTQTAKRYADLTEYLWCKGQKFTDKLPMNFLAIGPIHLLFPQAVIIYCRRNPAANCFSCYQCHFAENNLLYTYELTELGRYYRLHERLMDHWRKVLPGRFLEIEYEELVSNPETEVRRLLAYCKLKYEPGCLNFHTLNRPVATASSMQVRKPIYKTSVDHWKNYEPFLGLLLKELDLPRSRNNVV